MIFLPVISEKVYNTSVSILAAGTMKIAFFHNLNFGGAKRVVFEQVKSLSTRHKVDVYKTNLDDDIFDPVEYAENIYKYEIPFRFSSDPKLHRLEYDLKTLFTLQRKHEQIAREIDSRNYDIVLVHPDKFTQAPFLTRYLKTKSVYYCQEPLRIAYEYSLRLRDKVSPVKKGYEEVSRYLRKRNDRINVRSASYSLASCLHIRERMIESYDVYPDINYPGIDTTLFRPKTRKKKNQLLFIGGKDVVTDGYDLLKSAVMLLPSISRPEIKIVTWKKQNNQRLTDEELIDLYNDSLAAMCMSRLETFGLVPLEAMACGVPVIATNISGHRETIVHGKTGYLVEFHPHEIAEYLLEIISNPRLAKAMGEEGVRHVKKNWTWKKSTDVLEKLLLSYEK